VTATVDLVADLRTKLPPHVARQLHDTQRLIALVGRAVNNGWTVPQLAHEATRDPNGAINLAALAMWRLERCAETSPPTRAEKARQPLCGGCEDGFVVDPGTRLPIKRCNCREGTP
jgi:hypothetical protein